MPGNHVRYLNKVPSVFFYEKVHGLISPIELDKNNEGEKTMTSREEDWAKQESEECGASTSGDEATECKSWPAFLSTREFPRSFKDSLVSRYSRSRSAVSAAKVLSKGQQVPPLQTYF